MKRILSVLLCAVMIAAGCVAFSSCGNKENGKKAATDSDNVSGTATDSENRQTEGSDTENNQAGGIDGGWTEADSPEISDELKALFDKACETLTGTELTPVSLLETQVVAGMNYRILCESTAAVPDAETEKVIVTLYVDPQGSAEITDISDYQDKDNTQIANPVVEYGMNADSPELAKEAVGFSVTLPGSVEAQNYIVINGELLEVVFDGGYIRKAGKVSGVEDISGDYNEYENSVVNDVGGIKVTFKGNADKIMLAIWTAGDYTYCIGVTNGVSEAEMTSLVNAVK